MDSGTAKHGRNIFLNVGKRHDGMWVLLRGMSELFQSGERLFGRKIKDARMGLDDLKVESGHLIEEESIGSKPRTMFSPVVQDLLHRGDSFSHARFLSEHQCSGG